MKSIKGINILFIHDDFGYKSSYYLLENRNDPPKQFDDHSDVGKYFIPFIVIKELKVLLVN